MIKRYMSITRLILARRGICVGKTGRGAQMLRIEEVEI
jgi:hypothetical protein